MGSVLGAVMLAARVASAQPAVVVRAAQRACGRDAAPTSVAGPWRAGDTEFTAAVFWHAGAARACLVTMSRRARVVAVVAHGAINAGASDRYHERSAPALRAQPLWLPGHPPLPVTETLEMGVGGGGGHATSVWLADAGGWRVAYAQVLDGATDINAATEQPCATPAAIDLQGTRLRVAQCYDGETHTVTLRFDGRRFVP